ncbi:MAG TPA: BamA/TamA family outer membrane protein [Anaeromyxobacteraceae bacterium]|nr:BamA/TamA family outer membrane protein [Anaeromyxobacteraceae bacterium]
MRGPGRATASFLRLPLAAIAAAAAVAIAPGVARAQETDASPPPVVEVPPRGDALPHAGKHGAEGTPPGCTESRECARREGYGSVCVAGACAPYVDRRDIFDLFRAKPTSHVQPEAWTLYPSIIPAIGYNPALGFLVGVVSKAGMYLGDPADTTISNASLIALLTTNKQLVIQLGTTVMTSRNEWQLIGDWRFLLYNQDTYGLGTSTPPVSTGFSIMGWGTTTPIEGGQPMKFDLIRIHQVAVRRVWGDLYAGLGVNYDRYFGIVDEDLDLQSSPPTVTSHYAYSTYFGFDPSAYTLSGLTLNAVYDNRDSTINAYRGIFARAAVGGFPTWLGSSQGSTMVAGELRAYLGLSDAVPRNVLAFWVLASGVTSGHVPYLALPSLGWDAAGTTGRGYVQGRFRGTSVVYAEAEWRFRVSDNGLFGGALFANATTMSRPGFSVQGTTEAASDLFASVKPAAGFGARIMMSKESRTNLRVDFAWGVDSFAVYLGAGEVF